MTKPDSSHHKFKSKSKIPELGSVDRVQQKLYSKTSKIKPYKRKGFGAQEVDQNISTSWGGAKEESRKKEKESERPKRKAPMTVFTKALIISIVFFIFSLGAAAIVYYLQVNEVSYDAVELSVRGPNSISAGEELVFDVYITNNNQVNLVLSDIVINYPTGTIDPKGGLPMKKDIRSIDEITAGLSGSERFKAILFGSENDLKEITVSFQYRVPGSDILFFKERVYQVELDSAPVVINAKHSINFQSGDKVALSIELISNASKVLRNLLFTVDYPFGFEFVSSTPLGIDHNTYVIKELQPGERIPITINGIIRGQDNEERTFRYSLGSESSEQKGTLGTVYALDQSSIRLTKPPITLTLDVNGDKQGDVVVKPGQKLKVVLGYQNNIASKILDMKLSAHLDGIGYDKTSIKSRYGYYQSSQNLISWKQSDYGSLAEIEPQEGGKFDFELEVLDTQKLARDYINPEFSITFDGEGTNFDSGDLNQKVRSRMSKKVKIETTARINAYLLHSSGPFENIGTMFPQVDKETSYTLVLEVSNSTNRIEDTKVYMTLPPYVSLREMMQPQDAQVDFDARSRELVWHTGTVNPGVGYTGNFKRIYLSLIFEPSANQLRKLPVLVQDIRLTAQDSFTETEVKASTRNLTSELEQDPEFDMLVDYSVRE
ncbi:MAG: hypothetical protein ACKKL4_02565 [Patescibacteria group bacterium]